MEIKKRAPLTRALLRTIVWPIYWHRRLRGAGPNDASRRENPSRIALFVSMELLGGGVIISSMVKTIRRMYPDAKLYIVGEQYRTGKLEAFFKNHSWVDDLIICPLRDGSSIAEWIRFYGKLRSYRLDLVVLSPNHSCSDSVWLYLCGIPHIIGCYLPKTWEKLGRIENRFLTERLTVRQIGEGPYRLLNFPEAYARTLTQRDDLKIEELVPYLRFDDRGSSQIPPRGPKVILHPGGPAIKRWPVEKYGEIGKMLVRRYGAALSIIGGKPEAHLADEIVRSVSEECPGSHIVNCCGCSLNDTITYIAHSTLYIGNNTGPYQIAVALGVPVIGVFREQDRWFSGPDAAGDRHCVVSRTVLADLPVEEVWGAIERRWPISEAPAAESSGTVPGGRQDLSFSAS